MADEQSAAPAKRKADVDLEHADTSSSEDIGPSLPTAPLPPRKKRKLPHEQLFAAALPRAQRYARSLMHRSQVSHVFASAVSDFVVTVSVDGVVKFWKKTLGTVEFVKEFRAHKGAVRGGSLTRDGRGFATVGEDGTVKIFDVVTFDLLAVVTPDFEPRTLCWVHGKGSTRSLLAVSCATDGSIAIYDGRGEDQTPIHVLKARHRQSVKLLAFNYVYDCVISIDEGGMIEYWQPHDDYSKPPSVWEYKSSTDLFTFKKAKSVPTSITISPQGHRFVIQSQPDRLIRVFDFRAGKLYRSYDESFGTLQEMQEAGTSIIQLETADFHRRLSIEKEAELFAERYASGPIFDESGHFIIYPSIGGTKVINTYTNDLVRLYGQTENIRPLSLALYQGAPQRKDITTISMAASANPLLAEAELRDPMLLCSALNRDRFYMFTNDASVEKSSRDVQNERPKQLGAKDAQEAKQAQLSDAATLHTTLGDIAIRLYPQAAPLAVENFVTHSRNGYYNNVIFHRVIRKFMIQTGDPLGDGTGGESIWGKEFKDEFSTLKHDRPYTVSMANAGPDSNGSQFFVTTEKTPWLDGKHTIFGRVVRGMDVVHRIEGVRCRKEKPEDDVKIVNISVE